MKSVNLLVPTIFAGLFLLLTSNAASAAIEPRSILKTFFETGDIPTQDQFSNLIDSFVHKLDDGLSITGIGNDARSGSNNASKKFEDDTIDATLDFAPIGGPGEQIPPMAPEFGGHSGFLALRLSDASSNTYYGYFQLSMDDPLAVDPAGIHIDYFVFNSTPDESITITSVPEPATLSLLALASAAVLARRRKH